MPQNSDVIIVGAGLIGCATAFHLSQRGVKVTVLEKNTVGAGGTGRSSAIVRQHYSNELTARMALHGLRVFQEFDERVGGECDFRKTGWVTIASADDLDGMAANVQLLQSYGIDTELLTAADLQAMVPGMDTKDLGAVVHEPESGYADPHLTLFGYADAAKRLGTTIVQDCRVTGIRFAGGRVAGVDTPAEAYDAPVVVNCAGPWGAQVAEMAGVSAPIICSRVQVAVFRRPGGFSTHPVVMDFINGIYLRPETGNISLVGSIDPAEAKDVVDPDDFPEHATTEFLIEMGEQFVKRYPPMETSECLDGYASIYSITPDWHPIIDEVPAGSGNFLCSGFSGHGFKLAPAVGLMTADLILKESDPEFPTHMFRFNRFAEGDLVRGKYEYSITG
jgi:glycine/D-amino acid oxidase-like deaminating enzyme